MLRTFAQILRSRTSDTLELLGEMLTSGQNIKTVDNYYFISTRLEVMEVDDYATDGNIKKSG